MNFDEVPGWIKPIDQLAFKWVLEYQNACEPIGDVVELGAFKGKSAIVIGRYLRANERFTVCDLFETAATSSEIHPSIGKFYKSLTQQEFEKNYLAFSSSLPTIVRGPSSSIVKNVKPDTCRFIHIDASHMYEHVREDIASAKLLLRMNGVVAFDDYRAEHTPGTAAAVWEAVVNDGLRPIFHTAGKLFATWGDPLMLQGEIIRNAKMEPTLRTSSGVRIRDMDIVRLFEKKPPKAAP